MHINGVGIGQAAAAGVQSDRAKPSGPTRPNARGAAEVAKPAETRSSASTDQIKVMAENVRAAVSAAHVLGRDISKIASGAVFDVSA